MPEHGLPRDEVMQQLITMKQDDQDWRGGRVFSLVYSAGDDVHELLSDALALYSAENGLNVLAFPSIGVMQHDIVSNTASLLGADDPAAGGAVEGYLTSGGTESLLQAVKTARDVGPGAGMARPRWWRPRARTPPSPRRPTTSTSTWSGCPSTPTSASGPTPGRRLHRRDDHGGGLGADLPPGRDRPHRRHRRRWRSTAASCAMSTPAWAASSCRSWPSSAACTSPSTSAFPA